MIPCSVGTNCNKVRGLSQKENGGETTKSSRAIIHPTLNDQLRNEAEIFKENTKEIKRKMWWRNKKMWLILIVIVVVLIAVVAIWLAALK
ncbi:synaptobrevin_vamp [Paramuricea clavata]|uniref:Synaptobrevin_vamp, partial n=2 Tax=Paramuricea clavata TaxID=317549 RepID=A0A7D9I5H1_PARCT|nr:synaptobrevin_vamp [Paramuricea clavata]